MGKGDKKSKRGKIVNGTWGVRRKRKIKKRPTIEEKINPGKKK
ncbi:30S ribosomal protein THX [Arenibacter sp. F26102]|nr:30S ribosomal protein THX [Arenibacter sp. F26102]MCK0147332.1 30S ribosomal protein THX [Arenibacter sp. F26102]